jgi:hypothetical protein
MGLLQWQLKQAKERTADASSQTIQISSKYLTRSSQQYNQPMQQKPIAHKLAHASKENASRPVLPSENGAVVTCP